LVVFDFCGNHRVPAAIAREPRAGGQRAQSGDSQMGAHPFPARLDGVLHRDAILFRVASHRLAPVGPVKRRSQEGRAMTLSRVILSSEAAPAWRMIARSSRR